MIRVLIVDDHSLVREEPCVSLAETEKIEPVRESDAQRHPLSHFALSAASVPACDPTTLLLAALTPREQDVLRLIAQGRSNKEIASELGLQMGTVKGYVSAILLKLEVADRTQAALFAIKQGV